MYQYVKSYFVYNCFTVTETAHNLNLNILKPDVFNEKEFSKQNMFSFNS